MNRGGAETMVMNHYRALDRTKVQFDFLVHRQDKGAYDDEIESLGGRIFRAPAIRPWTYLSYFRWLNTFFKGHISEFKAVHGHIQENSGFALYFAKKYGIEKRIASSHIANLGIDFKYIFRQFGKLWTWHNANVRLACGEEAGKFLYGHRDFKVLKNAIPTQKYLFNPHIRFETRQELGLNDNQIIIGSVARLCPQKNHKFILDTFRHFFNLNPNSTLLLVGEGPLSAELQMYAQNLNIANHVRFLGARSDINRLLQAFDVFFMPSLFEGLPVSVIEAQAAGLQCVLSDTIDSTTNITGNVHFISLDSPAEVWVSELEKASQQPRTDTLNHIVDSGYDVRDNIRKLFSMYGLT